jgi:hypothetical protein
MAADQAPRASKARSVTLRVSDNNPDWTMYEGTREVLIERAGIPADAFDERHRVSARMWRSVAGERRIEVRRKSPHQFLVYVQYPAAEVARRCAEREARRKASEVRRETAAIVSGWSTNAVKWRDQMRRTGAVSVAMLDSATRGAGDPGFRYDDETLDELGVHLQAIRGLLETGTVIADPGARAAVEAKLRARVLDADPALSRFMAAAGLAAQ